MQRTDDPRLPYAWKDHYPFRLACPSFVYPADYDVNVDRLGPYVDDIELLCFESRPAVLPSASLINRLKDLGARHRVGYHVHLPTDLALFVADPARQQTAVETLVSLTRLLKPLQPVFYILHLEMTGDPQPVGGEQRLWQDRIMQGLERLATLSFDMSRIRIENQSIPLEWLEPVLQAFDLMLCLDIGHWKLSERKLAHAFARWHPRIDALHLHGVSGGRDHRSLKCLSTTDQRVLTSFLRSFTGSVCVEVFDFEALSESLQILTKWMDES